MRRGFGQATAASLRSWTVRLCGNSIVTKMRAQSNAICVRGRDLLPGGSVVRFVITQAAPPRGALEDIHIEFWSLGPRRDLPRKRPLAWGSTDIFKLSILPLSYVCPTSPCK